MDWNGGTQSVVQRAAVGGVGGDVRAHPATMELTMDQPPIPPNERCSVCDAALNTTRGASFWHNRWWCLPCFAKGSYGK